MTTTNTFCPVSRTLGRHPEELLPAIPLLIGYRPSDSLVCLFFDGSGSIVLSSRVDWDTCRTAPDDVVATLAERARNCEANSVLVASIDAVRPDQHTIAALALSFLSRDFELLWAGETFDDSWRGLECSPACGEHLLDRHHPTVVGLIADGLAAAPDRDTIVAEIAEDPARRIPDLGTAPTGRRLESWRDDAIERMAELLRTTEPLSDSDVDLVTRACRDLRVRDVVLWRITNGPHHGRALLQRCWDVFAESLRRAPSDSIAPVAAVAALIAWQLGEGTRAMECLKRARAADPDHSLADLVFRCIDQARPPSLWHQVMAGLDEATCRYGHIDDRLDPQERSDRS